MSFFEGGRKTTNQYSTTLNQQVAIQGGGNFAVSGGVNLGAGARLHVESLDPLALEGMERVSREAILASGRYVEFASESNRMGLATVGDVAKTYAETAGRIAGAGMTPEQIAADRGTVTTDYVKPLLIGLVAVVGLIIVVKKYT